LLSKNPLVDFISNKLGLQNLLLFFTPKPSFVVYVLSCPIFATFFMPMPNYASCVMAVSTFPPFFKRVSFKSIFSLYIQHKMSRQGIRIGGSRPRAHGLAINICL
jgi:hypothetical protein